MPKVPCTCVGQHQDVQGTSEVSKKLNRFWTKDRIASEPSFVSLHIKLVVFKPVFGGTHDHPIKNIHMRRDKLQMPHPTTRPTPNLPTKPDKVLFHAIKTTVTRLTLRQHMIRIRGRIRIRIRICCLVFSWVQAIVSKLTAAQLRQSGHTSNGHCSLGMMHPHISACKGPCSQMRALTTQDSAYTRRRGEGA